MIFKKNNFSKILLFALWALFGSSILAIFIFVRVNAQNEQGWSHPINLSSSGGANTPIHFIDDNGFTHVIWEDFYEGMKYSFYDGEQWSAPTQVGFPFLNSPGYLSSFGENVYTFWIDEQGNFKFGRVTIDGFSNPGFWQTVNFTETTVSAFDVKIDDQGTIHLGYVTAFTENGLPSGVYYQRSENGGASWSIPISVYDLLYFRSLTDKTSNVKIETETITTGDVITNTVYMVWDDRNQDQILFSKSQDGVIWEAPFGIIAPDPESGVTNPFNIRISVRKPGEVLLVWQNGILNFSCTQSYQWSSDGGNTWSEFSLDARRATEVCPGKHFLRYKPRNTNSDDHY